LNPGYTLENPKRAEGFVTLTIRRRKSKALQIFKSHVKIIIRGKSSLSIEKLYSSTTKKFNRSCAQTPQNPLVFPNENEINRYRALCGDIGLFCRHKGLFCEDVGQIDTGLFVEI